MKTFAKFVLFLALVLGCVTSTMAESKEVTMQVGETQTLYLPSSVTSKVLRSVTFYSNGISYVQVLSSTTFSVKVKAIKAFSSPIIVRCDYYYLVGSGSFTYQLKGFYDFVITVVGESKVTPTKITFPTSAVGLEVGETRVLSPTVYPSNAEYTLTWYSNDKSVATVSQDGVLTARSEGTTDIKVMADNGVYAMLHVAVYEPSPSYVTISPSSLDLTVGDERSLSATVHPIDAPQKVKWSTSDSSVVTVSDSGKVTAIGAGTCVITAKTSNGKSATCSVTVSPKVIDPTSVALTPESAEVEVGESTPLTVTVLPVEASTSLSWASSDNTVATVADGVVAGLSAGTCNITVTTDNGLSATSTIIVKAKEVLPQSIELSEESIKLIPGETTSLSAQVYPEESTVTLTWESSDPNIAMVENGVVIAIAEGECVVTVLTQNGLAAKCTVTVEKREILPEIMAISDSTLTLTEGETATLSVTVEPFEAVAELTWTSSDENVAIVENGEVTAVSEGMCEIKVSTQNGLTTSCHVIVEAKEPIVVEPTHDWSGNYQMTAYVEKLSNNASYSYPEEFEMEIVKGNDGSFYITSFIGLNVLGAYPYTGMKLNILSDYEATIDLGYSDEVGGFTIDDEYLVEIHFLSPSDKYSYTKPGNITLTREDEGLMTISDFYVFGFGDATDYEFQAEAHYTNCRMEQITTGLERVQEDEGLCQQMEIFTLNGQRVYCGDEESVPELAHGVYIVRKGGKTYKVMM